MEVQNRSALRYRRRQLKKERVLWKKREKVGVETAKGGERAGIFRAIIR